MRLALSAAGALWIGCAYPDYEFVARDAESLESALVDAGESDVGAAPDVSSNEVPDVSVDTAPADVACTTDETRCAGRCVDTSADRLHCGGCGNPCKVGERCATGSCGPLGSCGAIRVAWPQAPSGVYVIDPTNTGSFSVYCEMIADGGGWTLALKMDGAKKTFAYDSSYWTNDATLEETSTDLSPTEAKHRSFSTIPFTRLRLGMLDGGLIRYMTADLARSSLKAAFSGGAIATSATRARWFQLLADPVLQANCNAEGVNQDYPTNGGAKPRLRIGIVGNQENDCNTPDSYVGFGAEVRTPFPTCFGTVDPGVVVGNVARFTCGAAQDKSTTTFGYVFVR